MSFSGISKYDLFVSYASADDIDEYDDGRGWISEFVCLLERVLRSRLGGTNDLQIFFDRQQLASNHELEILLDAARQSAVFLAVSSSAYRQRSWTQQELDTFCEHLDDPARLFVVEYLPLLPGETHLQHLKDRIRLAFWNEDPHDKVVTPLLRRSDDYRRRLHQLAVQIAGQLITIRNHGSLIETGNNNYNSGALSPQTDSMTDLADIFAREREPKNTNKNLKLVIAKTAADMEADSERMVTYFAELGYQVIDAADIRQGGEDFKTDIISALKDAVLFLIPIGSSAGRTPSDLPKGYYATQLDLAKEACVTTMIWRRPTTEPDDSDNSMHASLLDGPDVIASTYTAFLAQARKYIETISAERNVSNEAEVDHGLIFINADKRDRNAALKLQAELVKRGIAAAVPMFEGSPQEISADLNDYLLKCDTMLLLYGEVGIRWVRAQLMNFSKMRPRMCARIKAVCIGPPAEKPTDLGFMAPDLQIVDVSPNWSHVPILELMGSDQ